MPLAADCLLFLTACLGHLVLMVWSHNWWYGQAFSKAVGDVFHLGHGFLVAAFPFFLWYVAGLHVSALFDFETATPLQQVVAAYVALCWLALFVGLPINTLQRRLRSRPQALLATQSFVVDYVKTLGRRPGGAGKQGFLASLPGNEVYTVEFVEKTLRLPRLPPAWDGLKILHLSDLHLCGTPDRTWYRAVMDRCNAWDPDLVAVTGDVADSFTHHRWIIPVLGRLRSKIAALAILGNHDYWYKPPLIRGRITRVGMHYLGNGWRQLDVRGQPLVVIGHEGPWVRPAPDLAACPAAPFRLCLSHTPDNIAWARRNKIDLMLSGHVHGGQIRVPVFGSILVPSRYGRKYDCGVFDEGPTVLHVSRGLAGDHPLRYGCRPEATLLVLRRGDDSGAAHA